MLFHVVYPIIYNFGTDEMSNQAKLLMVMQWEAKTSRHISLIYFEVLHTVHNKFDNQSTY